MAMVLESAAIPRESTIPVEQLRSRFVLPKCTVGFRIEFPSRSRSPSTSARPLCHFSRSSRNIVCEQRQETLRTAGEVNDETWQKVVLDSDVPVLVDFWAPWCGPCRMIAPIVDELSLEYAGKVKCVKLNTDESPNTATKYGIRSIPTVMIFKGGEKKDSIIGAVPKATLVKSIEKFL